MDFASLVLTQEKNYCDVRGGINFHYYIVTSSDIHF